MLNIGLIGLGFMGRTHLENYIRLENEGLPIRVVAICDSDPQKLQGRAAAGNLGTAESEIDLTRYNKYGNIAEMLEKERIDIVDIALPTYLHKEVTVQCLNSGLHVFCEKPMAMNAEECEVMIRAAETNNKKLMIGQCLRFWPEYVYLKELVDGQTYGKVLSGYFFRGGGTPNWAEWLTDKYKSGGALMDMHVHDVDAINWLFGMPKSVSCQARNVVPGSGYDIVSAHYNYDDGKVVNAQVDWTLQGDFGFEMTFRVNFERGNIVFQGGQLKVNPNDAPGFVPELNKDMGYYHELNYFVDSLLNDTPISTASPVNTMQTIEIVAAEIASADRQGAWVPVNSSIVGLQG